MFVDASDSTYGSLCIGDKDYLSQQLLRLIPDDPASVSNPGGTFKTPYGAMTLDTGGAFDTVLKRNSVTHLTLDGDSVNAAVDLEIAAAETLYWVGRTIVSSPADSRLLLTNNAGTDFDRLQIGGTTSSFPAIRRRSASAQLEVVLADASNYAFANAKGWSCRKTDTTEPVSVTDGVSVAGITPSALSMYSGGRIGWSSHATDWWGAAHDTAIQRAAAGKIQISDPTGGATTPMILVGGSSSSFPALKRNGTGIDVRLADDSNYTTLTTGHNQPGTTNTFDSGTSSLAWRAMYTRIIDTDGANDLVLKRNATEGLRLDGTGLLASRPMRFTTGMGSIFDHVKGPSDRTFWITAGTSRAAGLAEDAGSGPGGGSGKYLFISPSAVGPQFGNSTKIFVSLPGGSAEGRLDFSAATDFRNYAFQDRDGTVHDSGGQNTWTTGIGAITHILGPTDQALALAGSSDKDASLTGGASSSTTAGAATLTGGAGTSSRNGGAASVTGGAAASGTAGAVVITGGATSAGVAAGGAVNIAGGASSGGTGGNVTIKAGDGFGTSDGDLKIQTVAGVDCIRVQGSDGIVAYKGTHDLELDDATWQVRRGNSANKPATLAAGQVYITQS